jgi:methylmalonyl-CoA mutase cobalamin-binding subunit
VDVTTVDFVDGLVVPPEAVVAAAKSTAHVIANVRIISANDVAAAVEAALAAGAGELSLYHAGLASDQDLDRMRRVLNSLMP